MSVVQNRFIVEATISSIEATKRLDPLNDKKVNSSDPIPVRIVCFQIGLVPNKKSNPEMVLARVISNRACLVLFGIKLA